MALPTSFVVILISVVFTSQAARIALGTKISNRSSITIWCKSIITIPFTRRAVSFSHYEEIRILRPANSTVIFICPAFLARVIAFQRWVKRKLITLELTIKSLNDEWLKIFICIRIPNPWNVYLNLATVLNIEYILYCHSLSKRVYSAFVCK